MHLLIKLFLFFVSTTSLGALEDQIKHYLLRAEQGHPEEYYNVGLCYHEKKEYANAVKYYRLALDKNTVWADDARLNLAHLLMKGLGVEQDVHTAMELYQELASKNSSGGLYNLGIEYLQGNKVIQKDPQKAYDQFRRLIHTKPGLRDAHYEEFAPLALISLGLLEEKTFGSHKPNLKEAYNYFAQVPSRGQAHIARLIVTKKLPGNIEEAKNNLKLYAQHDTVAAFIYGTILIEEDRQEEAIKVFENISQKKDTFPIVLLQLGIASYYGVGTEKDEKKAQDYFNRINHDQDHTWRSLDLARGYMRLLGLGVKHDTKKGLALLKEAESKKDDVFFTVDQLFPTVKRIQQEFAEKNLADLLRAEEQSKQKSNRGKAKAILEETGESSGYNAFKITVSEWNSRFKVDDGSFVSVIDPINKSFIIDDPQHHEQLIVKIPDQPGREFAEIEGMRYHDRIIARQGQGQVKLKKSTVYNHTFAEMLDYVIQYAGKLVPWLKSGASKPEDQLIAEVTRRDMQTHEGKQCKAEYTFGEENGEPYVYHRLLRPVKTEALT